MIDLKAIFKNKTKYTSKVYEEFLEIHRNLYYFSSTLYTVVIIGLLLFCVILQLRYHIFFLAYLFAGALTIFLLWRLFHPLFVIKKEYESKQIQEEKEFIFYFYPKSFQIRDGFSKETLHYFQLYQVVETNHYFYLYLDRTHALLLKKENFSIR